MSQRPCLDCGQVTDQTRCPTHTRQRQRTRDRTRAPAKAQRYDAEHRALRRRLDPLVQTGTVPCTRCHQPIPPGPWHLDHRPWGSEPAHVRCNATAGGSRIS